MKRKITIAIIENQPLFRVALKTLISQEISYKVTIEANNGQEFIRKLNKQFPPEIVLMDIEMPLMDGFETTKWIRENCPKIKVVIISTNTKDEAIFNAVRLGARGFIAKTATYEELKTTIQNVIKRGYFLTDEMSDRLMKTLHETETEYHHVSPTNMLTEKEITFLKHACSEKTYKEIANDLGLSPRTIDSYRDSLFEKLSVKNRVGLAVFAIKHGLIDP